MSYSFFFLRAYARAVRQRLGVTRVRLSWMKKNGRVYSVGVWVEGLGKAHYEQVVIL